MVSRRVLALLCLFGLSGCGATTIHPPSAVAEPARVGVLDHGRHSSLIVEAPGGMMTRYAYGEWSWFAMGRAGFFEAFPALFAPTKAALGRRLLPGPFSPEAVSRAVRSPVEDALYFAVEADRVRAFVARLERIFEENSAVRIDNPAHDLEFVPYPEPYSATNNSNQVMGKWLEELGCRLDGPALFSAWRLGA